MNNKDLINRLHSHSEAIKPTDKLEPESIEELLNGVKRKNHKGVISACATFCVVCFAVTGVFFTMGGKPSTTDASVKNGYNADSYSEIYNIVNTIKEEQEEKYTYVYNGITFNNSAGTTQDLVTEGSIDSNSLDSDASASSSSSTSTEFSRTNVQVTGVDEADAVKTDGKYIYSLYDENIFITEANEGTPKLISTINLDFNGNNFDSYEMYVYENRLAVIAQVYSATKEYGSEEYEEEITNGIAYDYNLGSTNTYVAIFDLSDINKPVQTTTLTQSGNYGSSRRIDSVIYITTGYSIYDYSNIEKDKPESYCPVYGIEGSTNCVPADSIIINESTDNVTYTTVSLIDLKAPDNFTDICSVLGANEEIYASTNNLYVTSSCYDDGASQTLISRFSINGTEIAENGSLLVDGELLNQFSMDEHKGYFRVVTEGSKITNKMYDVIELDKSTSLYVYDSDLKLVGKTENVAPGENVKSVRFDGDVAYFVTFRQTDPLFTVDLSDPTAPQILSELKIPGFSEYLHPFGENLLLGFGREADPETGIEEGLKLTMFDVSDKTNVTELATLVFTDDNSYSIAEYNHKAIFIDEERKLIGIPYITYSGEFLESYYHLFEYDEKSKEFISLNKLRLSENTQWEDLNTNYIRGLYIGNYFYVVAPYEIYSYDYKTFEEAGYINLSENQ